MKWPTIIPALVATNVLNSPAEALEIACGGYNPEINDHIEWSLKIAGSDAFDGEHHFRVRETKEFFILSRSKSRILINRKTGTYVTYGPTWKPVEWSRNTPGEGCDFSN